MRNSLLCLILAALPLLAGAPTDKRLPYPAPMPYRPAQIEVLVDGVPRPAYSARGNTYIEAMKNKEYAIRITNPYPVRVAVALSVDGLNTIDARHTDPRSARKWVLDPYQSVVISGWQTSEQQARRFFFTNEQKSYGAWLGQTDNLGVISAAFFREKAPIIMNERPQAMEDGRSRRGGAVGGAANAPSAAQRDNKQAESQMSRNDDLAATGIGRGVDHPVTRVWLDLEDSPAAMVSLRYEYHDALVSLGVFRDDLFIRREQASGFCPSPR